MVRRRCRGVGDTVWNEQKIACQRRHTDDTTFQFFYCDVRASTRHMSVLFDKSRFIWVDSLVYTLKYELINTTNHGWYCCSSNDPFFFLFFFYINRHFARNFAERERNLIYTGTYASVKIFLHPVDVPQSILLSLSIVIIFQHEQRIISKILESDEYKCRERGRDKNDMLRVNTISFRFSGTFYQYLSRIFSKGMIFKFNDSFSTRKSFFFRTNVLFTKIEQYKL